jgi:predicted acyl esterase
VPEGRQARADPADPHALHAPRPDQPRRERHLAAVLQGYDNAADVIVEGGYIRVVQDVRGKYGSEGDYVMNRPLAGR